MYQCILLTLIDCIEAYATDGLQTATEESDYFDSNQAFNVYDQEVTLGGKEYENRTEKLHSGIHSRIILCPFTNKEIVMTLFSDTYQSSIGKGDNGTG